VNSIWFGTKLGYFTDQYPALHVPSFVTGMNWVLLGLSLSIMILSILLFCLRKSIPVFSVTLPVTLLVTLLVTSGMWFGGRLSFSTFQIENDASAVLNHSDSVYFHEVGLEDLENLLTDQSGKELLIYIARVNCKQCDDFEHEITPYWAELQYGMNTYYTDSDRNGPESKKMYALLEKYNVSSVPTVLLIKDAIIVKIWEDPSLKVSEIVAYGGDF
jgi:thioredoxin-related protein